MRMDTLIANEDDSLGEDHEVMYVVEFQKEDGPVKIYARISSPSVAERLRMDAQKKMPNHKITIRKEFMPH